MNILKEFIVVFLVLETIFFIVLGIKHIKEIKEVIKTIQKILFSINFWKYVVSLKWLIK